MNYENIKINSDSYKALSDKEKLKIVREKLNYLFEEGKKEKHPYTITYNGEKKNVSKDNFGICKDLLSREKKLLKTTSVSTKYYTVKDSSIKRSTLVNIPFKSIEYKNMSIEEKFEVIKAKYSFVTNIDTYNGKMFDGTRYCKELDMMLEELNSQLQAMKEIDKILNIEISSPEYNKLDIENKIKVVKAKLICLTVNESEKISHNNKINAVTYVHNGQKMVFPCSKISEATRLIKLLKKLENNLSNNENMINKKTKIVPVAVKVKSNERKKKGLKASILGIPFVAKLFNKEKKEKKSFKERLLALPIISKIFKRKKKGKYVKTKKLFKEKFLALPVISKIYNKKKEKKSKNKKTIKERYQNSAFGRAMKKSKNRIITVLCATTLALATLLSSCNVKLSKKNHSNNSTNKPSSSQIDNENELNDTISKEETNSDLENDIIIDEITNPSIDEDKGNSTSTNDNLGDNINDDNYSLNDIITLEDSAKIFTNSYDATYNNNSINPYFDETYERRIEAVVYELNGYVYTIYNFESDASNKIQALEEKGAKMTAILVNRSDLTYVDGYEGYYNVVSVKSKVKSR